MSFLTPAFLRRLFVTGLFCSAISSAGTARYEFTGGSMAPTLTDIPAGVVPGNFVIGSGFGSLFDQGGSPDSLRITGTDGPPTGTPGSYTANTVLSFSLTIPADRTLDLETLTLRYKGTSVNNRSNARVYSNIRGHADATADTIGLVGRASGGTDANFVTSTVQLRTPSGNGANIQATDFRGLTNRTVTFEIPWMDDNSTASQFIDIDDVTLTFSEALPPAPPPVVTDFQVLPDKSSRLTLSGQEGNPYFLLASPDLTGPTYRKHWLQISNGSFAAAPTIFTDSGADQFTKRFYVVTSPALRKAKIMPVGDSITEGGGTFWVYRLPLAAKLNAAGYRFEYVGSKTSFGGVPHEGYAGNNATQVASQMVSHVGAYSPDIVLIHSGHNFDLNTESESQIIGKIETATRSMITAARTANPQVTIVLAQVITSPKPSDNNPNVVKYGYIPALNTRLAQVAAELNTTAQPVIIVNQAEGWDTPTDAIGDLVHPSEAGAEKMATKWFAALQPLLE